MIYSRLMFVLAIATLGSAAAEEPAALTAVPFEKVHIDDRFWNPKIETNRTATIEANLHQCQVTGRINNFAVAGKLTAGKHEGMLYNDSDVYKMIEGIAYALASRRDPQLERQTDAIIDQIAVAQQPDGYLDTYYTLVEPQKRWVNIQHGHELYCAGHLIEAAIAYQQATGKDKLLQVAQRLADHIDAVFGPDKRHDASGHEEIELALVKLWRATGERRYLDLARFFLDTRGSGQGRRLFGEYAQDHKPVRQQREVTGHAVRAMYLYAAMADVAATTGDRELLDSLDSIWRDVVDRKMYVTGGIGPSASNEGFTVPYDLPNDSAYAETCAAIGMALWNHRLLLMTGDGKYADVLEREVYNGLLSGVSLSGDRFFYVNPLGSKGGHHRVPWFDCSCCPTNIVRYIPGMGERAYATRGNELWTVLYMGGTADVKLDGGPLKVTQATRYPWDGHIEMTLHPASEMTFDLKLRVPGWCHSATVSINGQKASLPEAKHGYLTVSRTWRGGDRVTLDLAMPVERVYADPHVKADVGRVALQRGPMVYCLEGTDNDGHVRNVCLPREAELSSVFQPDLLGGVAVLRGEALRVTEDDDGRHTEPVAFQAVPYFAWDNRAPGEMVVWLPEKPELAELPGQVGKQVGDVRVSASHCWTNDTLAALADGRLPAASGDQNLPRMTWWPHRGGDEWVAYRFEQPRKISSTAVYWFDDTGVGQCRLPESWRLLWLDGKEWKPVVLKAGQAYTAEPDRLNRVDFAPVTTRGLRLEIKLAPAFSAGILEWQTQSP
ncbi:MAG TPA: beta-L-arabinofuranosidase domain-containing protein [Pirellulales bacterium]|nr:beta-L-arabinofuranosidase domain-containing protein [Pirellulales bacterium]